MALLDGVQEDTQEQDGHGDADGVSHGGVVHGDALGGLVVDELAQA